MFQAQRLPYSQTKSFTRIVEDYLAQSSSLRPFYKEVPTIEGINAAIEARRQFSTDRQTLVSVLKEQYSAVSAEPAVINNIETLLSADTFTITTAHQPNLFTGPLYFIYKILHAVKLAAYLKEQLPACNFVPVYYMGSEDADFAELNHTYVGGRLIEWRKVQSGAVGRMVVDTALTQLIDELAGQLLIETHGEEVIQLLKDAYQEGTTIQAATFRIVNELYGRYGLVVLIPDNPVLKKEMVPVFTEELFQQSSAAIVEATSKAFAQHHKVQAYPREINLFYLKDAIRERIIREGEEWKINNTDISFTADSLKTELAEHPERFSPNVILRGLFQETVLPNIAFIGGGGELAYWLQLKDLFQHYSVPYPVLVLRNSFLVMEKKWTALLAKTGLQPDALFATELELLNQHIRDETRAPELEEEKKNLQALYDSLAAKAGAVDQTLVKHIEALRTKADKGLQGLEKKMWQAERKRSGAYQNQVHKIKSVLFPQNNLQERMENFSSLYAKWGSHLIDILYEHSPALEQEFTILQELNENEVAEKA